MSVQEGVKRARADDPAGVTDRSLKHRRVSAMTKFVSKFMSDESGATAIEYGLIAALNAVVTGMGGTAGV